MTENKENVIKTRRWKHQEVMLLLEVAKGMNLAKCTYSVKCRNKNTMGTLTNNLNQKGGYSFSIEAVRRKWKWLKEQYCSIKNALNISGSSAKGLQWPYFQEMDSMLGTRPRALSVSTNFGFDTTPVECIDESIPYGVIDEEPDDNGMITISVPISDDGSLSQMLGVSLTHPENASVENDIEAERTEAFHNENDACTTQANVKHEFVEAVDEIVAEETKFPRSQGNGIDDANLKRRLVDAADKTKSEESEPCSSQRIGTNARCIQRTSEQSVRRRKRRSIDIVNAEDSRRQHRELMEFLRESEKRDQQNMQTFLALVRQTAAVFADTLKK